MSGFARLFAMVLRGDTRGATRFSSRRGLSIAGCCESGAPLQRGLTRLSPPEGEVTLVGVYDGREYRAYIKGINLSERALKKELGRYSLLVTFYGSAFDIPFLEACFPGINLKRLHFDLCFALRRLGLQGGLKRIEEELGLRREEEVKGMNGMEAVRLWKRWEKSRDKDALEKLVEYNRADVANLKPLAEYVYSRLKSNIFGFL